MCAVNSMKRSRDSTPIIERKRKMIRTPVKEETTHEFLMNAIQVKVVRGTTLKNFFYQHSDAEIEAYGLEVTNAIRSRDIEILKGLHEEGQIFQCSNRFGESVMHMACRQGSVEVVKFLIDQAGVSIQVKDDYGKTPLHDAFWNASPNFDLVDLLVTRCPSLLFVSDVRGHAPLQYARMEHQASWKSFFEERRQLIVQGLDDIKEATSASS